MGIDRAAPASTTSAARAPRSRRHFTPCAIPNGCDGRPVVRVRPGRGQGDAGRGRLPGRVQDQDPVPRRVARLRAGPERHRAGPPGAAQDQPRASTPTIEVQESATFIDNADAGKLDGIHILGWGADYPDMTNFLDYHFGAGASASSSATSSRTSPRRWPKGAVGLDDAVARSRPTTKANNAIRTARPDGPDLRMRPRPSPIGPMSQDAHASPLGNENFSVDDPGRSHPVRLHAERRAARPVLRRRVRRRGAPRLRADDRKALYAYEIGGTAADPGPGREVRAERRARRPGPARSVRA